jgi:hypothetical protein
MRTRIAPPLAEPAVPLLDASFLPAEEDWAVLEALHSHADGLDPDEDRFADLGLSAGDFE